MGGAVVRALLAAGQTVRVVVRDPSKAAVLEGMGAELAVADMADPAALAAVFRDAEGVFVLLPPVFDPEPDYPEARRVAAAVVAALVQARPKKVVSLSTVGADATTDNLLTQHSLLEAALAEVDLPITFLRAAWFLDNAVWDVPAAQDEGVLRSFLQPAGRAIPMVAARDVGTTAAAILREDWSGHRVVALTGPAPVSPEDIAAAFARALAKEVRVEIVQRETWEQLFLAQGMRNPTPRMRMLDGFNEGWISYSGDGPEMRQGPTSLDDVISSLVAAAR